MPLHLRHHHRHALQYNRHRAPASIFEVTVILSEQLRSRRIPSLRSSLAQNPVFPCVPLCPLWLSLEPKPPGSPTPATLSSAVPHSPSTPPSATESAESALLPADPLYP